METLYTSMRSAGCNVIDFVGSPERKSLCSTLTDVWVNGYLSDVVLCARGGELKVHRLILFTQCLKLKDKILNTQEKQISLDVDVSALRRAIEFLYTNKVSVPETDLEKVADVANILGMKELWQKTVKEFLGSKEVTFEIYVKFWSLASDFDDPSIGSIIQTYVLNNFSKVKRCSEFKALQYEDVKEYLTHPDLNVRHEDDRLSSALVWVREDTARASRLHTLLKAFPLRKMAPGFLDHLLDDPLIAVDVSSQCIIQEALAGISDTDRHKADVTVCMASKADSREKCHIIIGPTINGKRVAEVRAVRLSHDFQVVSLCKLPTNIPEDVTISSCMKGDMLYVSGLGTSLNEIWDISLKDWTGKRAKLITPRQAHTNAVGGDGNVFILGGFKASDMHHTSSIEVMDTSTYCVAPAGDLPYRLCAHLVSHAAGNQILVFGGRLEDNSPVHLYDISRASVRKVASLPGYIGRIWGTVKIKEWFVIVGANYTAVCFISDLLRGSQQSALIQSKYKAPNEYCSVSLSADETHIILLGGNPDTRCNVYQATVNDVINNKGYGWQPVLNTQWSLGSCKIMGGSLSADITLPT